MHRDVLAPALRRDNAADPRPPGSGGLPIGRALFRAAVRIPYRPLRRRPC